jgi:hypothetical protein
MVPRIQIRIPPSLCKLARGDEIGRVTSGYVLLVHSLCTSWIKLGFRFTAKRNQLLYQLPLRYDVVAYKVWILCRDRSDALGRVARRVGLWFFPRVTAVLTVRILAQHSAPSPVTTVPTTST